MYVGRPNNSIAESDIESVIVVSMLKAHGAGDAHLHENVSFQGHNLFANMFVFVFLRVMRTLNKYSIILNMRGQSLLQYQGKENRQKEGVEGSKRENRLNCV